MTKKKNRADLINELHSQITGDSVGKETPEERTQRFKNELYMHLLEAVETALAIEMTDSDFLEMAGNMWDTVENKSEKQKRKDEIALGKAIKKVKGKRLPSPKAA